MSFEITECSPWHAINIDRPLYSRFALASSCQSCLLESPNFHHNITLILKNQQSFDSHWPVLVSHIFSNHTKHTQQPLILKNSSHGVHIGQSLLAFGSLSLCVVLWRSWKLREVDSSTLWWAGGITSWYKCQRRNLESPVQLTLSPRHSESQH